MVFFSGFALIVTCHHFRCPSFLSARVITHIYDSSRSYRRQPSFLSAKPLIPMSSECRSYGRKLPLLWAMAFTPKSGNHHPYERLTCPIKECRSEHKKVKECRRRQKRTEVCRCPLAGFVTLPLHSGRVRCTNIL